MASGCHDNLVVGVTCQDLFENPTTAGRVHAVKRPDRGQSHRSRFPAVFRKAHSALRERTVLPVAHGLDRSRADPSVRVGPQHAKKKLQGPFRPQRSDSRYGQHAVAYRLVRHALASQVLVSLMEDCETLVGLNGDAGRRHGQHGPRSPRRRERPFNLCEDDSARGGPLDARGIGQSQQAEGLPRQDTLE